ncbi:MAG: flagellar basal body rod C-terminal domain-containing protein [Desulfovibrionaceae bacterium]
MSDMDASVSALQATATAQQVTAHNVANVNTDGFKASRTEFATGPDGQGVRAEVSQTTSPGPAVVTDWSGDAQAVEASNTDVAVESVAMMRHETTYAANAAAIRTQDEMSGTVIDLMA